MSEQPNNPLHNKRLLDILKELVAEMGWDEMGQRVKIKCFSNNPTIGSSLTFLRRTGWAKDEVQQLYLNWKRGELPALDKSLSSKTGEALWNEIIKKRVSSFLIY